MSALQPGPRRCPATTARGTPCRGWAKRSGDLCASHANAGTRTDGPTVADLTEWLRDLASYAPVWHRCPACGARWRMHGHGAVWMRGEERDCPAASVLEVAP